MAGGGGGEEHHEGSHEARECMACRGSGQVISNLGGSPRSVTCPWCDGSGERRAGGDAQGRWLEREESDPEPAEPPDSAA